ncbi:MAG: hypothetical protein J0I40_06585 [Cellulomonas sp.]|nr:hypothetical protein [Cellulomonas sp.]OJV84449.1 MAG: hypothetical protein BGO37_08515 [Cellulomonas sp. 73-92]
MTRRSRLPGQERDRLTAAAHQLLDAAGIAASPSRVRRLVAHHQRAGTPLDLARVIAYLDPTGETAARHVDRERGRR